MANSYLNRTPSSTGNNQKFTISCWLKRSGLGSQQIFANAYNAQSDNGYLSARLTTTDNFELTSWQTTWKVSSQKFRDTSAWYHFVIAIDTTLATAGDRIKIYVNGSQMTNFNTNNNPSQNHNFPFNTASFVQDVGANNYGSGRTQFWNGYISHYAQVDGSQLTPTSFGETDSTSGIWKFKSPSGITWGTNGVHLKFENSGAMGTDSSGNSNTYTVGGNLKQALDTPSNVYATLNPLNIPTSNAPTFSNANSKGTSHSSGKWIGSSTLGVNSGKWYMEVKVTEQSGSNSYIGVADEDGTSGNARNNGNGYGNGILYKTDGQYRRSTNGSAADVSYGNSYAQGDIIGIALNCDDNEIVFYKNRTAQNSGTAISIPTPVGFLFLNIALGSAAAESFEVNFGNGYFGTTAISSAGSNGNGSLFEYDVPSGYYALNTKNINTYG